MTIFEQLSAPFPPDRISWRIGPTNRDKTRGVALAYLDARDVMDRLDGVLGPEHWMCRYPHAGVKTVCEIGIICGEGENERWVHKADGAGDSQIEAEKGALSDAFKRAAVRWGIGRYLYSLDSPWVRIENGQIAPEEMPKLRALLEGREKPHPLDDPHVVPLRDDRATEALMDTGRAAATNGMEALKRWWLKLPAATRNEFKDFTSLELEPMALKADEQINRNMAAE